MIKKEYSQSVVCFEDYEVRGKKIFLEKETGSREFDPYNLRLTLKYSLQEMVNANCKVKTIERDGEKRIESIALNGFIANRTDRGYIPEELNDRLLDVMAILEDETVRLEIKKRLDVQGRHII